MLLEHVAPLVDEQVTASRTLLELGEVDVLLLRDALSPDIGLVPGHRDPGTGRIGFNISMQSTLL